MVVKVLDCTDDSYYGTKICDKNEIYIEKDYFSFDKEEDTRTFHRDKKYGYNYSLDDLVLVRTTEFFPFDKTILSGKSAHGMVKELPQEFYSFCRLIEENKTSEEKQIINEKLKLVLKVERNTIHFCLNGLVGSHAYGDFSDRPFIIIEPLKYHIDDQNLVTLMPADTFFTDRVVLSDEAVLIIKEEIYDVIKNDPEYQSDLERFKIYVYKGNNEKKAVSDVLNELGYDIFSISSHGYASSMYKCAENEAIHKMNDNIKKIYEEHNIEPIIHFYSKYNEEENRLMCDFEEEIIKRILTAVVQELGLGEDGVKKLDFYYKYPNDPECKEFINDILIKYGFERLCNLIEKINNETIDELNKEMIHDSSKINR